MDPIADIKRAYDALREGDPAKAEAILAVALDEHQTETIQAAIRQSEVALKGGTQ